MHKIPLSDIDLGEEEYQAIKRVLDRRWLTMGLEVEAFETAFARFMGVEYAIATSSCTGALHLAIVALGVGNGDEVIMPSLTFVATANILRALGARPVFVDITGLEGLNADISAIKRAITPRTKAICVTHFGGNPLDIVTLKNIVGAIPIVEDCAHAPGAEYDHAKAGTVGQVGCFSFFSNKNMTTGEGGMVTTNDRALADRVRLIRSHGMTATTMDRHNGRATDYDVLIPGYNYRMDEIRAALGLTQLARLDEANQKRGVLSKHYGACLHGQSGLIVPFMDSRGQSAFHLQTVILPPTVNRTTVREMLTMDGIQTSVHYPPIHLFTAYKSEGRYDLPWTETVGRQILTLPLYPKLQINQVEWVSSRLISAIESLVTK